VSIAYSTADGTASAGSDYDAAAGTVTFAVGETSKTITVAVRPDTMYELDETFNVNLSSPNGVAIADGQGIGTIRNDDSPPTISAANGLVTEGNSGTTLMTFTVTLSNASYQPVAVNYATADGTAVAGSDYAAASGTVAVNPGQTQATVTVSVIGDLTYEPDEQFVVNLSNAANASLTTTQVTGTIVNDDGIPALSVSSPSVAEGDAGTVYLVFTVSLANDSTNTINVDYATADGSAVAGSVGPIGLVLATALALLVAGAVALAAKGPGLAQAAAVVLLGVAVAAGAVGIATRWLGGITGDVLGAVTELTTTIALLAAVAR